MNTEHEGGWDDILEFLKAESIGVPDSGGHIVDPETIDEISGMLSTRIYRVLMAHGYPVPGDKLWLKPCAEWKVKNAAK